MAGTIAERSRRLHDLVGHGARAAQAATVLVFAEPEDVGVRRCAIVAG